MTLPGARRRRPVLAAAAAVVLLAAAPAPASAALACPDGVLRTTASDFVGLTSEDVLNGSDEYRRCHLNLQVRHHVGLLRQVFSWAAAESPAAPGSFDLSIHDRFVIAAARHNMRLLPILFDPPAFRSSRPPTSTRRAVYAPQEPAAFAAYAGALVRRYGRNGSLWRERPDVPKVPIRAWQVWNEPNLNYYWGGRPSARGYFRMLRAAHGAIKAVDPRAEVVTGGMVNNRFGAPLHRYVKALYRLGAKRYLTTLAVHPYRNRHVKMLATLRHLRALLNRLGARRTRLWVTEIGWADRGPRSYFTVGVRRQAHEIGAAITRLGRERRRLRLRGVVLYNWRDAEATWRRDYWGFHTGLLRIDGTAKPALAAFRRAAWRLRRAGRF